MRQAGSGLRRKLAQMCRHALLQRRPVLIHPQPLRLPPLELLVPQVVLSHHLHPNDLHQRQLTRSDLRPITRMHISKLRRAILSGAPVERTIYSPTELPLRFNLSCRLPNRHQLSLLQLRCKSSNQHLRQSRLLQVQPLLHQRTQRSCRQKPSQMRLKKPRPQHHRHQILQLKQSQL